MPPDSPSRTQLLVIPQLGFQASHRTRDRPSSRWPDHPLAREGSPPRGRHGAPRPSCGRTLVAALEVVAHLVGVQVVAVEELGDRSAGKPGQSRVARLVTMLTGVPGQQIRGPQTRPLAPRKQGTRTGGGKRHYVGIIHLVFDGRIRFLRPGWIRFFIDLLGTQSNSLVLGVHIVIPREFNAI